MVVSYFLKVFFFAYTLFFFSVVLFAVAIRGIVCVAGGCLFLFVVVFLYGVNVCLRYVYQERQRRNSISLEVLQTFFDKQQHVIRSALVLGCSCFFLGRLARLKL